MVDINAATEFAEVKGGFFTYVLCFIHLSSKEMKDLYGHTSLVIFLNIESDLGGSRVGV